tara:strand:- start:4887 stop:5261 length:375 start_codon:yes stop_codon:yes gene_type:complete
MGYRSEVVLVIDKRVEGMLMHAFTSCPAAHNLCHEHADHHADREDAIMFQWSGIKWYDSYPEVRAIEDLMDKLDEADNIMIDGEEIDPCDMYRFVRTGEDSSDVECRGYGFENIYPYTSINVEF